MMLHKAYIFAFLGFAGLLSAATPINDLVKTPPMGWNSWNVFHENINETQIKEIADIMVSSGMRDAGYIYLNLDDNWMSTQRDAQGNLQANDKFPSGMKALGDYIHSKGLKFGLYGDRGKRTCHHYNAGWNSTSGSYMREVQDAKKFAEWGVDYLKYDNCDPAPGSNQKEDYERMRDALLNSGREIVFSICAWGYQDWMPATGNLWRTTGDIANAWSSNGGFFKGVSEIIDLNEKYYVNAGPGHWNDPDMLEVGNGVLTMDESRSQMTMWSIMAAPLLTGNDIRKMTQEVKDIYMNAEMIAVNQDSAGIPGHRVSKTDGKEIWMRPLKGENSGMVAVALLNRNNFATTIDLNFSDVGVNDGEVTVRDIWKKKDLGVISGGVLSAEVPAHGVAFLIVSGKIVPQSPFCKEGLADENAECATQEIPGKIEAENYDFGNSGLAYSDNEAENQGDANFRKDGVDIVLVNAADKSAGMAIGYTVEGEWLEYTVNVTKAGKYALNANVASGSESSAIQFSIDDKAVGDPYTLPKTGDDWNTYKKVNIAEVDLTSGEHIIRLTIAQSFANVDWFAIEEIVPEGIRDGEGDLASKDLDLAAYEAAGKVLYFDMQGHRLNKVVAQCLGVYIVRLPNGMSFVKRVKK